MSKKRSSIPLQERKERAIAMALNQLAAKTPRPDIVQRIAETFEVSTKTAKRYLQEALSTEAKVKIRRDSVVMPEDVDTSRYGMVAMFIERAQTYRDNADQLLADFDKATRLGAPKFEAVAVSYDRLTCSALWLDKISPDHELSQSEARSAVVHAMVNNIDRFARSEVNILLNACQQYLRDFSDITELDHGENELDEVL